MFDGVGLAEAGDEGPMVLGLPDDPARRPRWPIIMQSTWMADRNGKEIFEGDVVELFNEKRKIRWADGSWYFVDREGDGDHVFFFHRHMEVIGNIYENPELMK
jgi:uncharacterized phage protein (TIGR01671 family)